MHLTLAIVAEPKRKDLNVAYSYYYNFTIAWSIVIIHEPKSLYSNSIVSNEVNGHSKNSFSKLKTTYI